MKSIQTAMFFLCCIGLIKTQAQVKYADTIQTKNGPLIIQPIQHATFVLSTGDKNIFVDPTGGSDAFKGIRSADLILITDIHGDHFDPATIYEVSTPATVIIAPQAVADKLPDYDKSKLIVMNNGNKTNQSGIDVTAIPMYNLPDDADSRHTKGRGNGYMLDIGGKKLYISGDTEDIPEMRNLKDVDIAFVCMNLPYTMDINQASDAVLEFKPKIVYPYHYRGQDGLSDVKAFKNKVNASDKKIDVRLKNWYPAG